MLVSSTKPSRMSVEYAFHVLKYTLLVLFIRSSLKYIVNRVYTTIEAKQKHNDVKDLELYRDLQAKRVQGRGNRLTIKSPHDECSTEKIIQAIEDLPQELSGTIAIDFPINPIIVDEQLYDKQHLFYWIFKHGTIPHNRRKILLEDFFNIGTSSSHLEQLENYCESHGVTFAQVKQSLLKDKNIVLADTISDCASQIAGHNPSASHSLFTNAYPILILANIFYCASTLTHYYRQKELSDLPGAIEKVFSNTVYDPKIFEAGHLSEHQFYLHHIQFADCYPTELLMAPHNDNAIDMRFYQYQFVSTLALSLLHAPFVAIAETQFYDFYKITISYDNIKSIAITSVVGGVTAMGVMLFGQFFLPQSADFDITVHGHACGIVYENFHEGGYSPPQSVDDIRVRISTDSVSPPETTPFDTIATVTLATSLLYTCGVFAKRYMQHQPKETQLETEDKLRVNILNLS